MGVVAVAVRSNGETGEKGEGSVVRLGETPLVVGSRVGLVAEESPLLLTDWIREENEGNEKDFTIWLYSILVAWNWTLEPNAISS